MPTIRQEINIFNEQVAGTISNATTSPIVQLDTTQYSAGATYYWEIIAKNTTGSTAAFTLKRFTGGTTDSTINVSTGVNSFTRFRSTAFTPPAGQTEYYVNQGVGTNSTISAARIIVIDNPSTLTSTETQIEIGMKMTGLTSTTFVSVVPASTLTKYWKYTAANLDGAKTFYWEVTALSASSKSVYNFVLQEDNGSFGSWTDVSTISNSNATAVRTRSTFTPTDGRNYRIAYNVASSKSAASIYNAKIIVNQGRVDSYSETNQNTTVSLNFAPTTAAAQSFAGASTDIKTAKFYLKKTGTPSGSMFAKLYAISGTHGTNAIPTGTPLATSDAVDSSTLTTSYAMATFTFSTTYTMSAGTNYAIAIEPASGSGTDRVDVGTDDTFPLHGGNYSINESGWSGFNTADLIFYINGPVTLLEPQYLLLNTADSNATGVQTYPQLWDSTEWASVTNVYKHVMDSDNASNSAKLRDTTASSDLTNSTVTGANQQISSAMTMPTTGDTMDTWVLNTTGVIGASRIMVATTVSASTQTLSADQWTFSQAGGTGYTQGLTAGLSFTGSRVSRTGRALVGVLSFAGAASRSIGKVLTGTQGFAGSVIKVASRPLTGALSFTGAQTRIRFANQALTATLSFTGSQSRRASHLMTGTLSFTGAQSRRVAHAFTGALSFTGSALKSTSHLLTGVLSFSGNFASIRFLLRSFTGTLSFTGTMTRSILRTLTGVLSFSGNTLRSLTKTAFTATLSFAGAVVKRASKAQTATLSFSGATLRRTGKATSGTLNFAGSINRANSHVLAAALSFTGSNLRLISHILTGTLSFTGNATKRLIRAVAGSLSFSGAVASASVLTRAFTGALSFTGSNVRLPRKALSATLTFTGSQTRRLVRALTGVLSFTGAMTRTSTFIRALTATLSFTGNISRSPRKAFTGALTTSGAMVRTIQRSFTASLGTSGSIGRNIYKTFASSLGFTGNHVAIIVGGGGPTTSPSVILLTDGRIAIRMGRTLYMPL